MTDTLTTRLLSSIRRSGGVYLIAAGLLLLRLPAHSLAEQASVQRLPQPSGTYSVGVVSETWKDESRGDPADPGATSRAVAARIWYPRLDGSDGGLAPYVEDASLYSEIFGEDLANLMASIVTASAAHAPVASSGSPFPVLLLSPGFSAAVFNYTLFAEELASYGYVVVAVGHPGMNAVTLADEGLSNPQNGFWHDWPVAENREMSVEERKSKLLAALDLFAGDQLFALERLRQLNGSKGWVLAEKLDLGRVASLGHSAGYLAPLGLMLASQPIGAFCFVDVTLDESPVPPRAESPVDTPTLLMRMEYARLPEESFSEQFSAPFYDVSFSGLSHASMMDFPYLGSLPVEDPEPARKAIADIRLVVRYMVSFLDVFLGAAHPQETPWRPERDETVSVTLLTESAL